MQNMYIKLNNFPRDFSKNFWDFSWKKLSKYSIKNYKNYA